MKTVLALGGGVNSTAILALHALRDLPVPLHYAVMAQTMTEFPETDAYVENIIKPFCYMENIPLIFVKSPLAYSLYDHYFKHKIIPTRMYRHCTDHFKIQPMKQYFKHLFPTEDILFILGIDAGEAHRAKNSADYFPLIDMGIDREGCKDLIRKVGLPIPPKSGCTICPFMSPKEFKKLRVKHPDKFIEAMRLEQNGSRYPEITITSKPLDQLGHLEKGNQELCNWLEKCPFCE